MAHCTDSSCRRPSTCWLWLISAILTSLLWQPVAVCCRRFPWQAGFWLRWHPAVLWHPAFWCLEGAMASGRAPALVMACTGKRRHTRGPALAWVQGGVKMEPRPRAGLVRSSAGAFYRALCRFCPTGRAVPWSAISALPKGGQAAMAEESISCTDLASEDKSRWSAPCRPPPAAPSTSAPVTGCRSCPPGRVRTQDGGCACMSALVPGVQMGLRLP